MPDPRTYARAAVLAGAMSIEPRSHDVLELRVPAVRRIVDNIEPPLDLTVLRFCYGAGGGEPLPTRHGRACAHRRHVRRS